MGLSKQLWLDSTKLGTRNGKRNLGLRLTALHAWILTPPTLLTFAYLPLDPTIGVHDMYLLSVPILPGAGPTAKVFAANVGAGAGNLKSSWAIDTARVGLRVSPMGRNDCISAQKKTFVTVFGGLPMVIASVVPHTKILVKPQQKNNNAYCLESFCFEQRCQSKFPQNQHKLRINKIKHFVSKQSPSSCCHGSR